MHAYCDHPGCKNEIDRGIGYVCCGDQDHMCSCGGFYCAEHESLCTIITEDEFEDLDQDDIQELLNHYDLTEMPVFDEDGYFYHCSHEPIEKDKEHPEWLKHVLTDETWQEWREKEPEMAKHYQELLDKQGKAEQ
ncbi:hypothetical protein [Acinetobacter sp. BSP-28]|uniref:hypothetical protein n=1 Tax=Acinetobacter sp. BSP-28 TaxID=3344661 RepID=UPI00376FD7CD